MVEEKRKNVAERVGVQQREFNDSVKTRTLLRYEVKSGTAETEPQFNLQTFYLLGTRIDNIDGDTARKIVSRYVEENSGRARKIFFSNVHSICVAQRNRVLKYCINLGDLVLADGSGLKIGGRFTGHPIIENLNGTDFTPAILKIAEERGWSVYLFGAKLQVVERCCMLLFLKYPRLRIVGFHEGHFRSGEEAMIVDEINAVHPDIVLVALGTPLQEIWTSRHAHELKAKICIAVGGLFDFLSLTRKRAPLWIRKIGFEWFYRFIQEPNAKWERVIVEIPMFFSLLFAKKLFPRRLQKIIRERVFS